MQEQLWNQLVQTLQEKANLSPDQAQQVAQVVSDFAQQHLGDLLKLGLKKAARAACSAAWAGCSSAANIAPTGADSWCAGGYLQPRGGGLR